LIVEKRGHVGGNSWSEIDPETGIEFHKYGSHLFHTSNEIVWRFVNRFDEFNQYRHSVVAIHNEKFFPIPINLLTLSQFFGKPFTPEASMN
jgi:UDP-galactopyranose mutase